ncbi:MAG TPA: ribosomal L7Ae/L30e/S12e/Gadd45 family protein [Candidatus Nanoarchaeia archaeon]|nr:ribosomal L7Ae/L30e/S12e/Gadd45 family protein [Candidatus Nanoarchaeia archaeon]
MAENLEKARGSKSSGTSEKLQNEMKDLKAKLQDGKAVIGKEMVLKQLRAKTISKLYLASNCPANLKSDLVHYAALAKVPVIELDLDNEELSLFCKKNFFITVLGTI